MYTSCALTSSSSSFHYVLGLWCYIMWHVMWLWCHVPLHHQEKKKKFKRKENIKSRKIDKRKRKMLVSKAFHNSWGLNRWVREFLLQAFFVEFQCSYFCLYLRFSNKTTLRSVYCRKVISKSRGCSWRLKRERGWISEEIMAILAKAIVVST